MHSWGELNNINIQNGSIAVLDADRRRTHQCPMLSLVFSAAAALTGPDYSSPDPSLPGWRDYWNAKYDYEICCAGKLLIAQGDPDAGDGQHFKSRDGADLMAYAQWNVLDKSLGDQSQENARYYIGKRGKITYRLSKPDYEVLSGDDGAGKIFYTKTLQRKDEFITFAISYPKALANRYGPIVNRLSRCLRPTIVTYETPAHNQGSRRAGPHEQQKRD